jgi:hypothetical protein
MENDHAKMKSPRPATIGPRAMFTNDLDFQLSARRGLDLEHRFAPGDVTMSAQNTLSRREALSLLGATTGSVVAATLTAQTAAARSRDVIGAATPARAR